MCCSCAGLFYRRSIRFLTTEFETLHGGTIVKVVFSGCAKPHQFCITCFDAIKAERIPNLCTKNGLAFPVIPDVLKVQSQFLLTLILL